MMNETEALRLIKVTPSPITIEMLAADLRNLGVKSGMTTSM